MTDAQKVEIAHAANRDHGMPDLIDDLEIRSIDEAINEDTGGPWYATVRRLVTEREQSATVDALMAEVTSIYGCDGPSVVTCDAKALRAVLARLGAK